MRFWLTILSVLALSASAYAATDIVGRIGKSGSFSGGNRLTGGSGTGGPPPTGDILLVDGVSLLLQTDGASFVCRAGGC